MKFHQQIRVRLCILLGALFVSACQQADPVGVKAKARMVEELISDKKGCEVFKNQLELPELKDGAIGEIYQQAITAGCIQKDV